MRLASGVALLLLVAFSRHVVQSWVPVSSFSSNRRPLLSSSLADFSTRGSSFMRQQNLLLLRMQMYRDEDAASRNSNDDDESSDDEHDNDEEPVFYDDFGGQFIGGGAAAGSSSSSNIMPSSSMPSSLQERIQTVQQAQMQKDAQLFKNWKTGNWNVRGFSLGDDSAANKEISISHIVAGVVNDDDASTTTPPTLWVARSNGSVVCVQLGTAYWTQFSQTSESETKELVRQDEDEHFQNSGSSFGAFLTGEESQDDDYQDQEQRSMPMQQQPGAGGDPFEIVQQFTTGNRIAALVAAGPYVFTSNESSGDIVQWMVCPDEGCGFEEGPKGRAPVQTAIWNGVHDGSTIIGLQAISLENSNDDDDNDDEPTVLFSAAENGSMALWDLQTGTLLYKCHSIFSTTGSETVTSAHSNGQHVYVGTSTGHVHAYVVQDLLAQAAAGGGGDNNYMAPQTMPVPTTAGRWLASTDAVTAIQCAGAGSLGRGRGPESATSLLVTGDAAGVMKQWEVMSRASPSMGDGGNNMRRLEQWPKLATQRLPKKAHVFSSAHADQASSITAIRAVDTKIVSAATDGTVRAWDPVSGQELFAMHGFDDDGVNSLCLISGNDAQLLITNGMQHFVCVHDFGNAVDPLDDEGAELDYLDNL